VTGFASPDVPAYVSYLLVVLFGAITARATLNDRLAGQPDRWAFLDTWVLFAAHVVVPVLLLWFLDYTDAVHDTSLFAALLVAFGYRQIFSGSVQGIALPGQTSALWVPFDRWVNRVADRIATANKRYRDRFDEVVRSYLSGNAMRLTKFETVARERSKDEPALAQALSTLRAQAPPGVEHKIADLLLKDLRVAEPLQYGYLLYRRDVLSLPMYWRWSQTGRSKLMTGAFIVACVVGSVVIWRSVNSKEWSDRYHQWRFAKANATDLDRSRSYGYLSRRLDSADVDGELIEPLLRPLQYAGITAEQTDRVLRLVTYHRNAGVNRLAMPLLVESLHTENPDVRLRVHQTLSAVQAADYAATAIPDKVANWVPARSDSVASVDERARAWSDWWTTVQKAASSSGVKPAVVPAAGP